MTDSPDAIRADIERTRRELGSDVDALADKVSPSKAVHRQAEKVRGAVGSVRERIMGTADDAGSAAGAAASDVAHSAADAAHAAKAKAKGSPLGVGLIAFGAGLLVAALLPASSKERELAAAVKEQAGPLVDEAKNLAQNVADDLAQPAKDAATAVKDRAQDAVETVRSDASDAAGTVTDRAHDARDSVSGQ
jgi:gas vesicle protein